MSLCLSELQLVTFEALVDFFCVIIFVLCLFGFKEIRPM